MNAIFHRVSIRKFQEKPVEQEKITLMLRAAMAAPSACNQQPWEFYVVTDMEKIEELSESTPFTKAAKGAPLVFVPCYRATTKLLNFAEIDMSASVQNLLLEAVELGLGAVWMGIAPMKTKMKKVQTILGIPDDLEPFALVPCGYPAEERPQQDRYDEERVHYI